jgi:hypothetical protein
MDAGDPLRSRTGNHLPWTHIRSALITSKAWDIVALIPLPGHRTHLLTYISSAVDFKYWAPFLVAQIGWAAATTTVDQFFAPQMSFLAVAIITATRHFRGFRSELTLFDRHHPRFSAEECNLQHLSGFANFSPRWVSLSFRICWAWRAIHLTISPPGETS